MIGRRDVSELRQQLATDSVVGQASLERFGAGHAALKQQVDSQDRRLDQLCVDVDALRSASTEQEAALKEFGHLQARQAEAAKRMVAQLEQLETFASRAAAEVNELRQRVATPPVMPVGYPVMATAQPAFGMTPQQAASASPAELFSAARNAQEEFARRQRQAMAGAFQQPPGGQ
jgi:hypothetical protein